MAHVPAHRDGTWKLEVPGKDYQPQKKQKNAKKWLGNEIRFVSLCRCGEKGFFVHKEEAEGATMNPGERGDLRWRVGSVLWCDGADRPGAHGVNSLSGLRGYGRGSSRRAGKQRSTINDQQPIMSDRCSVASCTPERQAGPASEDSCSKFQMLNAKCSVLNALHRRYPCRSFTPCAPGRGVKC